MSYESSSLGKRSHVGFWGSEESHSTSGSSKKKHKGDTDDTIGSLALGALSSDTDSGVSSVEGRVSLPSAKDDGSGVVTVMHKGRKYSYDTEGSVLGKGATSKVFKATAFSEPGEDYVLIVAQEMSDETLEMRRNTHEYQCSLFTDVVPPSIEEPGHIVAYTDKNGNTREAVWIKRYDVPSLEEYMVDSLPSDSVRKMGDDLVEGMRFLISRRSTYMDLKPENVGVNITNGVPEIKIRDFDLVFDIPEDPEAAGLFSDKDAINDFIQKLDGQLANSKCTPPEYYHAQKASRNSLIKVLEKISSNLQDGLEITDSDKNAVREHLQDIAQNIQVIQQFQLSVVLYQILMPDHSLPYPLTDGGSPDPEGKEVWLGEAKESLESRFRDDFGIQPPVYVNNIIQALDVLKLSDSLQSSNPDEDYL